jgi:hypothetical protein
MPSLSTVRPAGKCDRSTTRIVFVLSDAECLMRRPHLRSTFLEQSVFEDAVGHTRSFNACFFPAEILHLVAARRAPCRRQTGSC